MPQAAYIWANYLLEALTILGCFQLIFAAGAVRYYAQQRRSHACTSHPPVSILVPLHGAEPGLFNRLAALCRQDYAGKIQLVLGTRTHGDVIDTVRRLKSTFPNARIDYIADRREHGSSRKFSNLINMMSLVRHDHIVFVDSDVQVQSDYVANVIGELQQPGVEAVSCVYRARPVGGFWDRLAALSINADFLPQVVVALACRLAQPCLGPTIAMRRQTLDRIGGLSRFVGFLGADYLIGQAVRACGGKVVFASIAIECACFETSGRELFARQLRAARTIKVIKPWIYPGTVVTYPLSLAIICILLHNPYGFLLAAAAVSSRMLLYYSVERAFGSVHQPYYLIPLQDIFSFVVFIASFFGRTIVWRGTKYQLNSSLRLLQIEVNGGAPPLSRVKKPD